MVYADNAATTQTRQEVLNIMMENLNNYGNPSSIHCLGQKSKSLINNSRKQIANLINSKTNEIYFTSGGTESNNIAIKGYVLANKHKGNHIITSKIEHASVMNSMEWLSKMGFRISYLDVNSNGIIDIEELKNTITTDTILISIMFVNNEIGTIQPISEIGKIAQKHSICFHTDAVQAIGTCKIDVNEMNIDMMSLSGHKLYAPKGVGALYIKDRIKIEPIIHGGNQEHGMRSGTENVLSVIALGKAAELTKSEMCEHNEKMINLKNTLINNIKSNIEDVGVNGSENNSVPNIISLSFNGVESESLLLMLDTLGVFVSSGSACSSGSLNGSYVLKAIGLNEDASIGTIRISLGKYNTADDIECIVKCLIECVKKLRMISKV